MLRLSFYLFLERTIFNESSYHVMNISIIVHDLFSYVWKWRTSVKNKIKFNSWKPLLYIAQVSLELAAPKIKRIILTNFENEDQKEESNRNENVVSSAVEEVIEEQQEQKEQQVEEKIEEEEELNRNRKNQ